MREMELNLDGLSLKAYVNVPPCPVGGVIFAHGSGSGRHSTRNQYVAATLNARGVATVLADLLTEEESLDRRNVFDIGLLASRVLRLAEWFREEPSLRGLPLGFFGASTGGGAALRAAAESAAPVAGVVSRGGRPDLAGDYLTRVRCPVLLLVGGEDREVLEMNRDALERLQGKKHLEVIPNATHLFEEPGALDQVAYIAAEWFITRFRPQDFQPEAPI